MDPSEASPHERSAPERERRSRALAPALLTGALGIVFGDIGTSPLYAFRQCLSALGGERAAPAEVLGILSLVVWSLILVVGLKYVTVVMRADNDGEGGIAALMALALPATPEPGRHRALLAVGIVGIALFLGDGMITPAISVLSAVEGLSVATPAFEPSIVPVALGILAALFLVQSRGSGRIGRFFGPVMALWFAVLGIVGLVHVVRHPEVLAALDPRYALHALTQGTALKTLDLLGAVFLALTGAEALYADMGHFGRRPIRIDWFALVLPALVLNYFGQGALVLADPSAASGPFYALFPHALLYPAIALATAATVIASQAVISGAFTLVQQAALLGLLPRLRVRQTSASSIGQVYLPQVNLILALAVAALVVIFRSSNALSEAYGIAVVTTMLATTVLAASVASCRWGWSRARIALVFGLFAVVDLAFFAANLLKIPHGGWFPVGIGAVLCFLMVVWQRGRAQMLARISEDEIPFEAFLEDIEARHVPRVEGTGIYLTARRDQISPALLLNLRHNRVLHEHVVLLNVEILRSAYRPAATARLSARSLPQGFVFATLRFGFMERPEILDALSRHPETLPLDPDTTSFFVGREMPIAPSGAGWRAWQAAVYALLVRNAVRAPEYFKVPTKHTVELGTQVEL